MQGYLESCRGRQCSVSCCARGYGENLEEFLHSSRFRFQTDLENLGITFEPHPSNPNLVWVSGCCNGGVCRVLEFSPDVDIRSIACKIFPYKRVEIRGGGYTERTIGLYLSNCPATAPNYSVPPAFSIPVTLMVSPT